MFKNREDIIFRFKLLIISFFTLWAILILAKAAITMTKEREHWMEKKDRYVKYNIPVNPQRGNILSDNGELLASSLPRYTLHIDFKYTDKKNPKDEKKIRAQKDSLWEADIKELCKGLSTIFPDWSAKRFEQHLRKGKKEGKRYYKVYPRRISYIQYKEMKKLPILNQKPHLSGARWESSIQREKPFGSLAKHTLGSLWAENDSAYRGLELKYDSILKGKKGIMHRQRVGEGYLSIIDVPAENGADIQTTLNVEMQDICETALKNELIKQNAESGRAILMEVATGDIKAIVNLKRAGEGVYEEMENFMYEVSSPGSIFKTVALAAAFEDKLITPYDSVPHHNKSHIFYGRKPTTDTGHYTNGTSKYSVIEVMEQSSNIGMGEIINRSYKKNPQKFIDRLQKMGVDDTYDILVGARSPKIKTPKDKTWSMMDLVSMSFGYVVETTPLNMVTFYNTIANGGKQMKPRLVKRIIKDGTTIKEFEPEVLREEALSPQTVKDLKMILYEVVNDKDGTGKKVKSDKFQIAGKTGTARTVKPGFGYNYSPMRYLLSFCGYFPADAPKYSCIVQIIKVGPGSGGGTSGVVFKEVAERVMAKSLRLPLSTAQDTLNEHIPIAKHGNLSAVSYLFDKLDIETTNSVDDSEDDRVWGKIKNEDGKLSFDSREIKENIIPDVRGMGAKDAIFLLKQAGLRPGLSGYGRVVSQSIPAGQKAAKGSYILITLKP